ncbi:MAG: cytochrome C oxidase subunit IV family protein [Egibacteraceae bacterium]
MSDIEEHPPHPGVGQYVEIGVILAVLTAIEVGLFYFDMARVITVPALLALTLLKFMLVVMWFMHLRFDSRWFRRLFLMGLGLAAGVYAITVLISVTGGAG